MGDQAQLRAWATTRLEELRHRGRDDATSVATALLAAESGDDLRAAATAAGLQDGDPFTARFIDSLIERRLRVSVLFTRDRVAAPRVSVDPALKVLARAPAPASKPASRKPSVNASLSTNTSTNTNTNTSAVSSATNGKDDAATARARLGVVCGCMARRHELAGNCLSCGRILCSAEGSAACPFCGGTGEALSGGEAGGDGGTRAILAESLRDRLVAYDRSQAQRALLLDYDFAAGPRRRVLDGYDALAAAAQLMADGGGDGDAPAEFFEDAPAPSPLAVPRRILWIPRSCGLAAGSPGGGGGGGGEEEGDEGGWRDALTQRLLQAARAGATDVVLPTAVAVAAAVDGTWLFDLAEELPLGLGIEVRQTIDKLPDGLLRMPWDVVSFAAEQHGRTTAAATAAAARDADVLRAIARASRSAALIVRPSAPAPGLRRGDASAAGGGAGGLGGIAEYWGELDRLAPGSAWFATQLPQCPLALPIRHWAPRVSSRRKWVPLDSLDARLPGPYVGRPQQLRAHSRLAAVGLLAPEDGGVLSWAQHLAAARVLSRPADAEPGATFASACRALLPEAFAAVYLPLLDDFLPDSPLQMDAVRANKLRSVAEVPSEQLSELRAQASAVGAAALVSFVAALEAAYCGASLDEFLSHDYYSDRLVFLQRWLDEGLLE
jgi:hypothetical protein